MSAASFSPTAIERAMLRLLARVGPRSVWEFGSSNINRLRKARLILTEGGKASVTDAGRAAGQVAA